MAAPHLSTMINGIYARMAELPDQTKNYTNILNLLYEQIYTEWKTYFISSIPCMVDEWKRGQKDAATVRKQKVKNGIASEKAARQTAAHDFLRREKYYAAKREWSVREERKRVLREMEKEKQRKEEAMRQQAEEEQRERESEYERMEKELIRRWNEDGWEKNENGVILPGAKQEDRGVSLRSNNVPISPAKPSPKIPTSTLGDVQTESQPPFPTKQQQNSSTSSSEEDSSSDTEKSSIKSHQSSISSATSTTSNKLSQPTTKSTLPPRRTQKTKIHRSNLPLQKGPQFTPPPPPLHQKRKRSPKTSKTTLAAQDQKRQKEKHIQYRYPQNNPF